MLNFQLPLLMTLLLISSLLGLTQAEVTCTEQTVNAFTNPSFETGDLTNWTTLLATGAYSSGTVVPGDSADGDYLFTIPVTNTWTYLKQSVSGLDTSKTYDLSVDYKIQTTRAPYPSQYCYLGWSKDSWSGFIEPRSKLFPSSGSAEWVPLSIKWQPTSSTHDIYLAFGCTYTGATVDFDNFNLPIGTKSICSTSTPSLASSTASSTLTTPTTSSSVIAPVTGSSIPDSQSSTSSSAQMHSPSPQSTSVQYSRISTPLSSNSMVVTVSLPVQVPVSSSSSMAVTHSFSVPTSVLAMPSIQPSSFGSLSIPVSSSVSLTQSTGISRVAIPSNIPHQSGPPTFSGSYPPHTTRPNGSSLTTTGAPAPTQNHAETFTPPPMAPLTTSTVLITRTSTIMACPSTVVHCPAASKTSSVITETVVAYTTVCPVTEAVQPIQATQTTSSIFSTRTATVTSCPHNQLYCALPHRSTKLVTETLLVSTTVYLAAVPTSDRRPIFVDNSAVYVPPWQATALESGSNGLSPDGQASTNEFVSLPGEAEVTRTQLIFQTVFVTQTAIATACPLVGTGASSAHPHPRSTSLRRVYF